MKKLLILILFPIISFAQKDTIPATLKYGGVTIEGTLIIPKQSVAGYITKTQLDSLGNKKQDRLTAGSNISIVNNVISASGGGLPTTFPQTINLPDQTFEKIINTTTTGIVYSDGSRMDRFYSHGYSTFPNINKSNRPDVVYLIAGYNVNANNGRANPLDGSWDMSVETHYDIPTFPNAAFEFHTQRIKTTTGKEIRGLSWYVDKVTGGGFHNFVTNSVNIFTPGYEDKDPMAKLFDGRLELRNNTVGNSGTGLYLINDNGQTIELHQRGGVPVFNIPANTSMGANYSLHWDSWNGLGLKQGFYNTNAEAKAANLRPGIDTYWTRVNGVKVLAQVE